VRDFKEERGGRPVEGNACIEIELDATFTKKSKHPNQKPVFRLLFLPLSLLSEPQTYTRASDAKAA